MFLVDFSWLRQIDLQGEVIIALINAFASLKEEKNNLTCAAYAHFLLDTTVNCGKLVALWN